MNLNGLSQRRAWLNRDASCEAPPAEAAGAGCEVGRQRRPMPREVGVCESLGSASDAGPAGSERGGNSLELGGVLPRSCWAPPSAHRRAIHLRIVADGSRTPPHRLPPRAARFASQQWLRDKGKHARAEPPLELGRLPPVPPASWFALATPPTQARGVSSSLAVGIQARAPLWRIMGEDYRRRHGYRRGGARGCPRARFPQRACRKRRIQVGH